MIAWSKLDPADANRRPNGANLLRAGIVALWMAMPTAALTATANMVGIDVGQRFGKLVPAGAHRLHLHCTGTGSPVVILEAGIGGNHLDWVRAQPEIAKFTTVCSYDRAGYGWSDPAENPRTVSRIATELLQLIQSAELETPVILVGHSFGGLTSLYFASRYPDLVAGLVLVDSMHPDQYDQFAQQGIGVPAQPSGSVIVSAPISSPTVFPTNTRILPTRWRSTIRLDPSC